MKWHACGPDLQTIPLCSQLLFHVEEHYIYTHIVGGETRVGKPTRQCVHLCTSRPETIAVATVGDMSVHREGLPLCFATQQHLHVAGGKVLDEGKPSYILH